MGCWLVVSTPLKTMNVSWDDDIPNIWKVIKAMFQTTNQVLYGLETHNERIELEHIHDLSWFLSLATLIPSNDLYRAPDVQSYAWIPKGRGEVPGTFIHEWIAKGDNGSYWKNVIEDTVYQNLGLSLSIAISNSQAEGELDFGLKLGDFFPGIGNPSILRLLPSYLQQHPKVMPSHACRDQIPLPHNSSFAPGPITRISLDAGKLCKWLPSCNLT